MEHNNNTRVARKRRILADIISTNDPCNTINNKKCKKDSVDGVHKNNGSHKRYISPKTFSDDEISIVIRNMYDNIGGISSEIENTNGIITIPCGHPGLRHEQYMCGYEDCECREAEGYCDTWHDNVERFHEDEFNGWAIGTFGTDFVTTRNIHAILTEKGYMYACFFTLASVTKKQCPNR